MSLHKKVYLAPKDVHALIAPTGNIYESTVIIAKRAKYVALRMKEALNHKLEAIIPIEEEKDSIDSYRQYELAQHYEKLPKPIIESTKEFLEGDLAFRYIQDEEASEEA